MTFDEWQASRGILPWTVVHDGDPHRPLRFRRVAYRLNHRLPTLGRSVAFLGVAAATAGIRFAHFVEIAEHTAELHRSADT